MRTGSVTLCRLSSSNSTVGWLRLVVSAQMQITLILRDGERIISNYKFTATNKDGFDRRKEIQTSTIFFQCDENVETDKSFGEILWAFEDFWTKARYERRGA